MGSAFEKTRAVMGYVLAVVLLAAVCFHSHTPTVEPTQDLVVLIFDPVKCKLTGLGPTALTIKQAKSVYCQLNLSTQKP